MYKVICNWVSGCGSPVPFHCNYFLVNSGFTSAYSLSACLSVIQSSPRFLTHDKEFAKFILNVLFIPQILHGTPDHGKKCKHHWKSCTQFMNFELIESSLWWGILFSKEGKFFWTPFLTRPKLEIANKSTRILPSLYFVFHHHCLSALYFSGRGATRGPEI